MTGISSLAYEELDGKKKTPAWANRVITYMRRDWRKLNGVQRAFSDRATLYSMNELTEVKESFDDEEFKKNTKFLPLPILEPMINAVVEEITQNPPRAVLKALDPSAVAEKKKDLNLLANRSIIENDRSDLHAQIGLPPYKLGAENFSGNVGEFDKLGFDSDDQEDVTFYEANLQKLNWEIAGQSVIDAIFKNSRFDKEIIRKLVKDVLATKTICVQKYVDRITGEIKDRYVDPQNAYGIFGQTNDGTDDVCRGWQDSVTVMQWLQMVGDEFDFERDWKYLLWGINYCNVRKFTGFVRNGVPFDCCGDAFWMTSMGLNDVTEQNLLDWSMAYTYKVYVGYIEWRSPGATSTFVTNRNNKFDVTEVPYDTVLDKKKIRDGYEKESRYQIPWYSSYFIATTSVSQWIWGFGKVYMQSSYGANDEYCNGTLCYYQEEGLSATEIAQQYLHIANFTFYRMLWVIYKAKPDPDEFVFDELLQLAGTVQRQFPQSGVGTAQTPGLDTFLTNIIKQQRAKHVRLRTYPRIDGRAVQQIHPIEQKGRGGLDPIAISMQAICEWAEANIANKIGINALRLGGNPQPRESTESEQNQVKYSMATTGYIYRMIQYLKEHSAVASLNYAQDIIKFKESLPYKWLQRIVGVENMEELKEWDKFAFQRCGLFIDDYNTALDKKDIKDAATIALQNQEIGWDEWYSITQTEDPKKASKLLGRYKQKAEKAKEAAELEKLRMTDEYAQKEHDREMQRMAFDRDTRWGQEDRRARGYVAAAEVNKSGKIEAEELRKAAYPEQEQAKSNAKIEEEKAKSNITAQQPLTT